MTESPSFIHLRVHSAYSLKEGALHVKKLPGLCETLGFPALAVTDTNNLFGALEFSECCARAGVQPIMGLQLAVASGEPAPGEKPVEPAPLALYAQDQSGWLNLMALSSSAFLDTDTTQLPHVTLDALAARAEGVICLTGGAGGPLGKLLQANRRPAAEALARLSARVQVVVLTNVPRHARDLRRRNLAALGMDYPMVENAGGKGRALCWMAAHAGAPAAFVDDSLKQHESAARRAPEVTRIHFVGAGHLRRLLPESPAAHHRVEGWAECEAVLKRELSL